ncbi:MAG: CBS domain-containing protein, partial [Candidatus Hadarchaeota archaeon]|nr:CBS domain-containing protein [Candidatus Hadarchaeota archaeon]
MKVKKIMTTKVQGVGVPGNRDEALELLKKRRVSALPVLKKGTKELIGIVTLRDLFENPDEGQLAMLVNR